jgi:hypothetical protein
VENLPGGGAQFTLRFRLAEKTGNVDLKAVRH